MLFPGYYGIIWAFLEGKREYPRGDKTKKGKAKTMGNEEMLAELNARLMLKETRLRTLAKMVEELPLLRENLPALECYAIEMRSLAYQIREILVAKAAALAAR